jgi:hypothetical protein
MFRVGTRVPDKPCEDLFPCSAWEHQFGTLRVLAVSPSRRGPADAGRRWGHCHAERGNENARQRAALWIPPLGAIIRRRCGSNRPGCHSLPNVPPTIVNHGRDEIYNFLISYKGGEKRGTNWQFLTRFAAALLSELQRRTQAGRRFASRTQIACTYCFSCFYCFHTPSVQTKETKSRGGGSGNLRQYRQSTTYSKSDGETHHALPGSQRQRRRRRLVTKLLHISSTTCFVQVGSLVYSRGVNFDRIPAVFQPSTSTPARIDGL